MNGLDFRNTSFGWSFWINKPSANSNFDQTLVEWVDQSGNGINVGLKTYGSTLKFNYKIYDGTTWNEMTSSATVVDDMWTNLIMCYDNNINKMHFVVNNSVEEEQDCNGPCSSSNDSQLYIRENQQGFISSCSVSSVRADYRCWQDPEKAEIYSFGPS